MNLNLEAHPLSALFPYREEVVLALAEDMKVNGYNHLYPVGLYEEKILDGRHRYAAAKLAGVEAVFMEVLPVDAEHFVIQANALQRHLSQLQIGCYAIERVREGETQGALAIRYGLGTYRNKSGVVKCNATSQAHSLRRDPDLFAQVRAGTLSMLQARKRIGLRSHGISSQIERFKAKVKELEEKQPADTVALEAKNSRLEREVSSLRSRLTAATERLTKTEDYLTASTEIGAPAPAIILGHEGYEKTQAVAGIVASDWHVEEIVEPGQVHGLNCYNPEIAKARATRFWQVQKRLIDVIRRDVHMETAVLGLLGDFITNDIHDQESAEITAMRPMEAARYAQDLISSGLNYLLESTDLKLHVVCHSGNHGRTTKKVFMSTESGHSIEWLMYCNLARYYESQRERIRFHIESGYQSVHEFFGYKVRMHHGHSVNYQGGVGGITIPVNKAIAQWNQAVKVNMDVFGHFHQYLDGGKFLANGSLIGYNAYALRIKAEYEPPRQAFFIIDNKRGRTWTAPVYL